MSFNPARTETCRHCGRAPQTGQVLRCEQCKVAFYCNDACRQSRSESHRPYCKAPPATLPTSPPSGPVAGVRLLCDDAVDFKPREITVQPDHPIWRTGNVSPLSQLLDVPILIHRETRELELGRNGIPELDNPAVTTFMIDPETGIAPLRWQRNIGNAIVVRADQQPLATTDLEDLHIFCQNVLNVFTFSHGQPPDPARAYTREALQKLSERYSQACRALVAGVDPVSLDFTADPLPLRELPLELVAGVPGPARGVQWIEIGPPQHYRLRAAYRIPPLLSLAQLF